MSARILVVDDEESLCEILRYNLEKEGYEVETALSGEEALQMDLPSFSLVITDIMMDGMNGYDLAKRIRRNPATADQPIILCSALNGEDNTVMGLNIGADDYITKPFVIGEVMARVRAVLRRSRYTPTEDTTLTVSTPIHRNPSQGTHTSVSVPSMSHLSGTPARGAESADDIITFQNLKIDENEKACYIDGTEVNLTKTEYDMLRYLLAHRNRIHSREEILKNVWPSDAIVTNRTIDTNMARLRKKIGEYGNHIVTKQGFGYGFKESV